MKIVADYSGNGELVLGTFKSLRAFRKVSSERYKAITHSDEYEIGKEYTAECRSWTWDISVLMKILDIPQSEWKNTLITGLHFTGMTWNVEITRRNKISKPRFTFNWSAKEVLANTSEDVYWEEGFAYDKQNYVVQSTEMDRCMLQQHKEDLPKMGCSCGFYSFYDLATMSGKGRGYVSRPESFYFGVIENYGKVVHCDLGLRSQKMKILDVRSYSEVEQLIKDYPLDVFDASSAVESFPPLS